MASGFQYVDFKNANLTGTPIKIDGVYETIEGNYRRVLILKNVNLNGSERSNVTAFVTVSEDNFELYYGNPGYKIVVTQTDMVSNVNI